MLAALRAVAGGRRAFRDVLSRSPKMAEVFEVVASVADTNSTVLISGESGTGKELVARAIHDHGARAGQRFVAVNCGAIP